MHRFFLEENPAGASRLELAGREAHHALHVLRLQPGERVRLLDGRGEELEAVVSASGRKALILEVGRRIRHAPLPVSITLFQAIPKGRTMETIVQKATELGAARIVPVLSDRAVVQVNPSEGGGKQERWRLAAIEALKQCGTPWLPQVDAPMPFAGALEKARDCELNLAGSLEPGARHPRACFEEHRRAQGHPPASVGIWVGPEGDWSPAEYRSLRAAGVLPVTFGPLVLRSDTAATHGIGMIQYELSAARDS